MILKNLSPRLILKKVNWERSKKLMQMFALSGLKVWEQLCGTNLQRNVVHQARQRSVSCRSVHPAHRGVLMQQPQAPHWWYTRFPSAVTQIYLGPKDGSKPRPKKAMGYFFPQQLPVMPVVRNKTQLGQMKWVIW